MVLQNLENMRSPTEWNASSTKFQKFVFNTVTASLIVTGNNDSNVMKNKASIHQSMEGKSVGSNTIKQLSTMCFSIVSVSIKFPTLL